MAESAAPSIELTAVDKASATLAAVKGKADELTKSADSIKSAWSSGLMDGFTKGPALAVVGTIGAITAAAIGAGSYFVGLAKDTMTAQAALKSMSEITGASVEGLSAIRSVAKLTGIDMESVAGGMTKLAKNMSVGGDEVEKALSAIGLSLKDMQGLKTDQQFAKIAEAMGGYADGAGKTAAAQILLGKSGAQLLPLMKDMAELGELVGKTTSAQAYQADALEKNIKRLTIAKEAWKKVVGNELVPVLDDVVTVLLRIQTQTNGTLSATKSLAADGSIKSWAESAALSVAMLGDMMRSVGVLAERVGLESALFFAEIGAAAAKAKAVFSPFDQQAQAISEKWSGWEDQLRTKLAALNAETFDAGRLQKELASQFKASGEQAIRDARHLAEFGDTVANAKQKVGNLTKPTDDAKDKVNALEKALSELMNKLNNPDVDTEWVKQTQLLTKALQVGAIGWVTYADAIVKSTAQSKTVIDMNKAIADSLKVNEDIIDKNRQAIEDASRAMVEGNKELAQEIGGLGLSKVARELYQLSIKKEIDLRRINATATGEERDMRLAELDSLYAVREELIKNKDQVEQNVSVWQSFSSTTTDFLTNLIQNGRSAFGDLYNQAKKFAAQLIAIFAQKYILGMEVQGGGGVAGGVLNSILGSAGGAGGGMLSGLASSLGLSGIGSAISSIAAPLAAVAAASYALGKVIANGYTIGKFGSGGVMGLLTGGIVGGLLARAFGHKLVDSGIQADVSTQGINNAKTYAFEKGGWFSSDRTTYGALDSATMGALEQARSGITDTLKSIAAALNLSTEDFDKFTYSLKVSLKGLSDADAKTAITKAFDEFTRGLTSTLDFSKISPDLDRVVKGFSGSADELIKFLQTYVAVIEVIKSAKDAAASFRTSIENDVISVLDEQTNSILSAYRAQTKGVDGLLKITPESTNALGVLVTGMAALRSAAIQLVVQIHQVKSAMDSMYEDSARTIAMSQMTTEQQYNFLQKEADDYHALALKSTDPLLVQKYDQLANQDRMQAWNLLTADQKQQLAPDFLAWINANKTDTNAHLGKLETQVSDTLTKTLKTLSDKLDDISAALAKSAEKMDSAADKQVVAADKPINIGVAFTANVPGTVETTLVGG